jgi:hypothetical protein
MKPALFVVVTLATAPATASAEATSSDPAPPTEVAAVSAPRWARGVVDRVLTLPSGLVVAGGDVIAVNTVTTDMAGVSTTNMSWLADVAAGYGVTDDLEINLITPNYTFALDDFEAKGSLDVGVGYKLLRGAAGGKLEMIARGIGGYDLNAEVARPVRIGFHVQYNVTPRLGVFTHDIGVGNAGISLGVEGDKKPISLTLPIGVGYQVTPALWIEADTAPITSLNLANTSDVFISDVTPALATAVYNFMDGRVDALAYVGFANVQHAGDTYTFGAGLRYYAGKVD